MYLYRDSCIPFYLVSPNGYILGFPGSTVVKKKKKKKKKKKICSAGEATDSNLTFLG